MFGRIVIRKRDVAFFGHDVVVPSQVREGLLFLTAPAPREVGYRARHLRRQPGMPQTLTGALALKTEPIV
jgi:hypothetical protein